MIIFSIIQWCSLLLIFSEDEECDSGALLLEDMWQENGRQLIKLMKLIILSSLIVSHLVYEDSTDESLSGCHETNSYVFKLKKFQVKDGISILDNVFHSIINWKSIFKSPLYLSSFSELLKFLKHWRGILPSNCF